jgi:hypothetical protein
MEQFMERNLDEEAMRRIKVAKEAEERRAQEELRDRFAIAALQGDIASSVRAEALHLPSAENAELMAERAYFYADAMLKARSKAA